jgi:hypothetical protein
VQVDAIDCAHFPEALAKTLDPNHCRILVVGRMQPVCRGDPD